MAVPRRGRTTTGGGAAGYTFALLSVDLDPSGGQKVEAIKTLRKFPTFREESGLQPDSDPIKRLFEEIQDEGQCENLDYERDVKSWIGQRAGIGAWCSTASRRPSPPCRSVTSPTRRLGSPASRSARSSTATTSAGRSPATTS